MKEQDLYQVLLSPHISEKATRLADQSQQFVFLVQPTASKKDIKAAVEKAFDVNVESVCVLNIRGKIKRTGRVAGRRKNQKKAYVRLKAGQDIDFLGAQA